MRYFLSSILFIISGALHGQSCPAIYSGTKTLYKTPVIPVTTAPPGYQPVFINYVSRHGARHLTKDVTTSFASSFLQKLDSMGLLNETGKKLKAMVSRLEKVEKKTNKSISYTGMTEQKDIAARMYAAYTSVFTAPVQNVMVTKEKRTVQSADAFLSGLPVNGTIDKYVNDTILRFYDLSPAYLAYEENGSWQQTLQRLRQQTGYNSLVAVLKTRKKIDYLALNTFLSAL